MAADNSEELSPGIFVTQGMNLRIPAFSIRVGLDGKLHADAVELHADVDVTPAWLEIAFEHVRACERAELLIVESAKQKNADAIGDALYAEMKAGMQAIVTSCAAVDAYYANIKTRIDIPASLIEAWKKNGTARHRQIAEVLRLGIPMSPKRAKSLQEGLEENFSWRDEAIHPTSGPIPTAVHDVLNKRTAFRFVKFRCFNARAIAGWNFKIVYWTAQKAADSKHPELRQYCHRLEQRLVALAKQWDDCYGKSSIDLQR